MKNLFHFGLCATFLFLATLPLLRAQTAAPSPPATTNAPAATPPAASAPFTNSLGLKFVPIPDSTTLFCTYLTRVRDYAKFIDANHREWHRPEFSQTENDPVVLVSWEDAVAFCSWLTQTEHASKFLPVDWKYRLPTDAEWTSAVTPSSAKPKPVDLSGTPSDQTVYPWGTDWPPPQGAGNYHPSLGVDSYPYTSPVGSFAPNAYGLYDMGGNVWEWCLDRFNDSVDFRVLRGASWHMRNPGDLLSSARVGNQPNLHLDTYGFRCVIERRSTEAPPPSSNN